MCQCLRIKMFCFARNQASAQSVSVTNYSRGLWNWMCFSTHGLELRADMVSRVVGTELH